MRDFKEFDNAMDAEYMRHFPEKGDSWKTCNIRYLWDKLRSTTSYMPVSDPGHLLDVALMCRMIWTRYHSSEQSTKVET